MPAVGRKAADTSLVDSLDARIRTRPVDNFASIKTYYRSAILDLRQADTYRRKHNDDELYIMLSRFASTVIETIPRHRAFAKKDPEYQQLEKKVRELFPELESLKAGLREREALQRIGGNEWEEGFKIFMPTKTAGTVLISSANLPEIHWETLAASLPQTPPPPAGAQLGVPQPAGFDMGYGAPQQQQQQQVVPASSSWQAQAALPALPELSTSFRLPAARQATLAKHALLPLAAFGSTSQQQQQQQQHWQPERQQQPALAQRPLYPELAQLEPPPPPPHSSSS